MGGKSSSAPKTTTTEPTPAAGSAPQAAGGDQTEAARQTVANTEGDKAVGDDPAKAANVAGSVAAEDAKRSRYRGMKRDPGSTMGANQGLKTSAVLTG